MFNDGDFDEFAEQEGGLTTEPQPAIIYHSAGPVPHVLVPTTFQDLNSDFYLVLPDGTVIAPAKTRVGVHEVIVDEVGDWYDAWVVWDGAAPEMLTHGSPGHSKGLLLSDYADPHAQHVTAIYDARFAGVVMDDEKKAA